METNWISVNDRMPDDKQICLVYNAKGWAFESSKIVLSQYRTKYKSFSMGIATHWMPLPAPPTT